MVVTLRPYQEDVKARVLEAWRSGARNVCMVMPTGAGKTATKTDIIRTLDRPTCCIAHRQELVLQISESLARAGVHHRVIAPTSVVRFCAQRHSQLFGRSYVNVSARVAVAGVQTLLRRADSLRQFLNMIEVWDIDECFPAGTLVDGKPIETIRVGDTVTAFDEKTGTLRSRKVRRLFKRKMPNIMVRIATTTHHVICCTQKHPIWTKRGWVDAVDIHTRDEVLHAQGRVSDWCRVAGVSILERDHPAIGGDGYVYNIEVDTDHTYTANGLVVHNCHHAVEGNQWGDATQLFPRAIGLGVTATPMRLDRKPLDSIFDTMVVGPSMRDLIDQGHLSEYRIFCPPQSIDTDRIRISKSTGEYVQKDLLKEAHESKIVGDVVQHYLRIAPGLRGLTFAVDVQSATDIAAAYEAAGVPAAVVSAKTPDNIRTNLLDRLARGDVKQLVNVDLFGEGMDCPALEVVSMARPTQSYGLYVQQFGRVLRPFEGKAHGIVIDHVGNVVRHGLPDAPREWSLTAPERSGRRQDNDAIPLTTCVECYRPYERKHSACPYCGHKPVPASRSGPEHVDGDLVELDPEVLAQMRGAAARVMGDPLIPHGADHATARAIINRWKARQEHQVELQKSIAEWAGVWKYRDGETDSEIQRRFYLTFGIDVLTAQTLGSREAQELKERIDGNLAH
jgi:DNA repair protein RadD